MSGKPIELITNPPLWYMMLAQLFCLGAIEVCCERQLARWKAHCEATPPSTIKDDAPPAERPRPSRLERWVPNVAALGMFLVGVLSLTGLFKQGDSLSQVCIDVVYTGLMLHCFTTSFADALYIIFPRERYIRKHRGRGDSDKYWDFEIISQGSTSGFRWANPRVNQYAGFACASVLVLSSYLGRTDLIPLAAAAQVMWMIGTSYAPKFRMKVMVWLQAGVLAIFLVTAGCISLFSNDRSSKTPADSTTPSPSTWLLNTMSLFFFTVANAIPGAFMVVSMRYEYTRSGPPLDSHAPGKPVLIDNKAQVPFLPLHHLCIWSLIVMYAIIDALHFFGVLVEYGYDLFLIPCVAITATVGGTALVTFFRGDFKDWWNYTERWRPAIDANEITKLDGGAEEVQPDEKRSITP